MMGSAVATMSVCCCDIVRRSGAKGSRKNTRIRRRRNRGTERSRPWPPGPRPPILLPQIKAVNVVAPKIKTATKFEAYSNQEKRKRDEKKAEKNKNKNNRIRSRTYLVSHLDPGRPRLGTTASGTHLLLETQCSAAGCGVVLLQCKNLCQADTAFHIIGVSHVRCLPTPPPMPRFA